MRFSRLIIVFIFLTTFFSCKPNRLKVNVSDIDVKVDITRLEQLMFGVEEPQLSENIEKIKREHLGFFDIYTSYVLNIGTTNLPDFEKKLNLFITDTVISKVADSALIAFENINDLEDELIKGFKHYNYYFPNASVPPIYTCMSGFTKSVFICNDGIGIGIDKYFGSNCIFYTYLGVPQYKRLNMHRKKIVPDVFLSIFLSDYPFNDSLNNLLSNMIYQGKALYFAKAMCPSTPDSILFGFTADQLEWCRDNEAGMWTYLVEQKLLYNNERLILQRYIGDAPFTNTFSNDSPGRTGCWLGYRIVESYMNKNRETSLSDLLLISNSQQLLNQSGYFPD